MGIWDSNINYNPRKVLAGGKSGADQPESGFFGVIFSAAAHFSKFWKMAFFPVFWPFLGGQSGVVFGPFELWEASVADFFRRGGKMWGSVWGRGQFTGETAFWVFGKGPSWRPSPLFGVFPDFYGKSGGRFGPFVKRAKLCDTEIGF